MPPLPPATPGAEASAERAVVLPFNIKEKGLLYATYMSMIQNGAIFVPTNKELKLGDPVFVMLTLPEKLTGDERFPIRGKVIWWTPPRAQYKRVQGVGVQFPASAESDALCAKIEQMLGAHIGSERETQTF
ncbi:MAG: PilZ domain-containing protein [Brachymonas sp.]|nr:PilZ domain-containing protein [Brachymonas sp.]